LCGRLLWVIIGVLEVAIGAVAIILSCGFVTADVVVEILRLCLRKVSKEDSKESR
jgi:uncharacterized membrane protein YbaN (DUF454 family)